MAGEQPVSSGRPLVATHEIPAFMYEQYDVQVWRYPEHDWAPVQEDVGMFAEAQKLADDLAKQFGMQYRVIRRLNVEVVVHQSE